MTRAATSGELSKFRSAGQRSQLYLAVQKPATVLACRVNQTVFDSSEVSSVTFDTVTSGSYSNVLPGMTCYVGTAAGLYDLGFVRIRKAATSTELYIGAEAEINWADNVYLTVVNEFNLWAKHWYVDNASVTYMDKDVAYSDQNTSFDPVPILGPDSVLWLTSATVVLSPTAASSWVIGSSISGYSWSAPGASATANMTTATPTITYNAAGQYLVSCTITAANGKTATGYRCVFVYTTASPPVTKFRLEKCAGENDGWTFSITLFDDVAIADIRERAKVILFSKDWYGEIEGSIGPVVGSENIIATGWVDEEGIEKLPEQGTVKFTVRGPAYWLGKLAAFSGGLKNSSATPTSWLFTQGLTIDRSLHNLIHWRSTIDAVMDWYPSNDTRLASGLIAAPGSLWDQLKEICARILANPRCDRYGRLYTEVDSQFLASGSRTSIPVVQLITTADWHDKVNIPRTVANSLAMIEAGGTNTVSPFFSRSFGNVPGRYGSIEQKNNLLVASQADLNTITSLVSAQRNNPYPFVSLSLVSNNRLVDIAPNQYITLTLTAADTERGIVWTAKKLIPRRVEFVHDPDKGTLSTSLECEAETVESKSITFYKPAAPTTNLPGGGNRTWTTPPIIIPGGYVKPSPLIPPPVPPGTGGALCSTDAEANGPFHLFYGGTLEQNFSSRCGWAAKIRSHDHTSKSTYQINARFQKKVGGIWVDTDDDAFYNIKAYDSAGVLICTATHDALGVNKRATRTGWFDVEASSNIAYWDIQVIDTNPIIPDTIVASAGTEGRCGGSVVLDPGEQVWWMENGGIGFEWTGLVISAKYEHVWAAISINKAGWDCRSKPLFVESSHIIVSAPHRLWVDHKMTFKEFKDSMSWSIISEQPITHDSADCTITGVPYTNHDNNYNIGLQWVWDDQHYDTCHSHTVSKISLMLFPQVIYRLVIDSILLWNLCAADVA